MGHGSEYHADTRDASSALLGERDELPNFYEVLDVHTGATRLELREAYLQLKSTYGAGSAAIYSLMGEEEARAQLAQVEEAYRILSDDIERRAYDLKLGAGQEPRHGEDSWSQHDTGTLGLDIGTERILRSREQSLEMASSLGLSIGSVVGASIGTSHEATQVSRSQEAVLAETMEPMVVRTTRSMLPIVRLKASQVAADTWRDTVTALLESHHPGDGALYCKLREAAHVTEQEMQDRIKVSIAYIKAIESNQLEKLPQVVYVKGFLRSYFRYLAVPSAETMVTAFAEKLQECQEQRRV